MADEETVEQEQAPAPEAAASTPGRADHGAGLRLGLLLGIIAGAVIALLLARDSSAERAQRNPEFAGEPETPVATLKAALEGIRARVLEASREAETAAREVEERLSARYEELTKN